MEKSHSLPSEKFSEAWEKNPPKIYIARQWVGTNGPTLQGALGTGGWYWGHSPLLQKLVVEGKSVAVVSVTLKIPPEVKETTGPVGTPKSSMCPVRRFW